MAEEGNEQNQNSQPAGNSGGFVSLDQARDIALGHARDNQGFYSGRWRKKPLTWLVLVTEEREDAYYIRLSYQLAQKSGREPGVEAFTISKTGGVQSRSILSEPQGGGLIPGCGLVSAFALFVVLAVTTGVLSAVF